MIANALTLDYNNVKKTKHITNNISIDAQNKESKKRITHRENKSPFFRNSLANSICVYFVFVRLSKWDFNVVLRCVDAPAPFSMQQNQEKDQKNKDK